MENCKDEQGKAIGISCVPAEKHKTVMESILLVQTLLGQHRLFIGEDCENALREIPSYRSKPNENGKEEPVMVADDTCSCIRYATWMELNRTCDFHRYDKAASIVLNDMFEMEPMEY
jgi:phage terminase large subunit